MAKDDDPELTPEQVEAFMHAVARVERRRRIYLAGYLAALVVLLLGLVGALVYVGTAAPGRFVGWAFFVPLIGVGAVLWIFGRWAKRA